MRRIDKRAIFLIDGLGAFISFIMLGLALPLIQPLIGIPLEALYLLAVIAFIFMAYSLSCFFFLKNQRNIFINIIMTANVSYCLLTAYILLLNKESITAFGYAYFISEIVLILVIVLKEQQVKGLVKN